MNRKYKLKQTVSYSEMVGKVYKVESVKDYNNIINITCKEFETQVLHTKTIKKQNTILLIW